MARKILIGAGILVAFLGGAGVSRAITPPATTLARPSMVPVHVAVAKLSPGTVTFPPGTPWTFTCPPSRPTVVGPARSSGGWTEISNPMSFYFSEYDPRTAELSCGYTGQFIGGMPGPVPGAPQLGTWYIESIDARAKDCALSADFTQLNCHW